MSVLSRLARCSAHVRAHHHNGHRYLSASHLLLNSPPSSSGDPWGPLPHSPTHLANTVSSSASPPPRLERNLESVSTLRARLTYQARKRGTLESDLLLSTFAHEHLDTMGEDDLHEFDRLMDEPDWDIYYWATEKRSPPDRWEGSGLLEKLKAHAKNEGKVVRRMPNLPSS